MNQNLDHIIQFLKNLDSENKNLKIKINELELYIKNLTNDLDNLSKVSIISNLDKQLKEKMCIISSLEKVNSELQKKISSKNVNELNARILLLENEIEKNNSAYEEKLLLLKNNNTKLQDEIKLYIIKNNETNESNESNELNNKSNNESNELNNESNNDSEEETDNKYPIIFKKKNYLVDNDNNVYNIINNKANIIIGKLIKNKVKFL